MTISTALLIVLGVLALGGGAIVLAGWVVGLPAGLVEALEPALLVAALVAGTAYLVRHGR